jgi:methionyl-tRNA formyltransferase
MRINILCSDENHPVNSYLATWIDRHRSIHEIELVRQKSELAAGDILFLISCSELIEKNIRDMFGASLVLHASDLPNGKGWSPHVWQILEGNESITLSLLEAEDRVDSGAIWNKITFDVPLHALWDEINHLLFSAELELMSLAVSEFPNIAPTAQPSGVAGTYYPRRTPGDSMIDPNQSIAEQFDKIRVSDPVRYPATFELFGIKYKLIVEKVDA